MKRQWKEIPYSQFKGHEFDPREFLEEMTTLPYEECAFIFDKDKKLYCKIGSIQAMVKNPPIDFVEDIIKEYLRNYEATITQNSSSYALFLNKDGYMELDFLIDREPLSTVDFHAYVGITKKEKELEERIKEWSAISKKLGFAPFLPETITLKDGCKAVKLCTSYRKLKKEEIPSYVTETLLRMPGDWKLNLRSNYSFLEIKKGEMNFYGNTRDKIDAKFALSMMGKIEKEPRVRTYVAERTLSDRIHEWHEAHRETLDMIGPFSVLPIATTSVGAVAGSITGEPLAGAAIGGALGLGADGILLAWFYISDWKQKKELEKEKAFRKFAQDMLKQPHLKKPYGSCVFLSTEKCVLKSAKKESET
jgi:hypothetical protein